MEHIAEVHVLAQFRERERDALQVSFALNCVLFSAACTCTSASLISILHPSLLSLLHSFLFTSLPPFLPPPLLPSLPLSFSLLSSSFPLSLSSSLPPPLSPPSQLDLSLAYYRGPSLPPIPLFIIVESPTALLNLKDICQFATEKATHLRLGVVVFGSDDFLARLGTREGGMEGVGEEGEREGGGRGSPYERHGFSRCAGILKHLLLPVYMYMYLFTSVKPQSILSSDTNSISSTAPAFLPIYMYVVYSK